MSHVGVPLELLRGLPNPGPVFVHADLMRARCFAGLVTSRTAMMEKQLQVLLDACGDHPLWSPCFNYDFCRTGDVDLRRTRCQVGPLGEHLRVHAEFWQSADPVFSICGNGPTLDDDCRKPTEAFGPRSCFAQLYERDGAVLFYGAPLHSATILHYAESMSEGPVYRYDKVFPGRVTSFCGTTEQIEYVYHVRPLGMSLDYDWDRIGRDLNKAGLMRQQAAGNEIVARVCGARALVDFWVAKLKADPLYLLDDSTRKNVEAMSLQPGQRFCQIDFEPAA